MDSVDESNTEEAPMEIADDDVDSTSETLPLEHLDDNNSEYSNRNSPVIEIENIHVIPADFLEENSNQSEAPTVHLSNRNEADEQVTESVSKKRHLSEDENEDDGTLCPICLDNWTNTGEHRICALKCGHLFGYKCVTRWLGSQTKKSCPTCKKKVLRNDIRYIYAKKLIAVDTSEVETIQKQLNVVLEEKNRVVIDLAKSLSREHVLNQEIVNLKKQLYDLSNKSSHCSLQSGSKAPNGMVKLFMDKSLEVCKLSGCRVLDASSSRDLLVASIKSPNNLFSGYGLRKVNISSYKALSFIPIHSQQIRDVCFHPEDLRILSAGMDKAMKIVDITTNNVVCTVSYHMPLWSCCWDADNNNLFYGGSQSGCVLKYDIRNTGEPVSILSVPGDMSPVVSVASIPREPGQYSVNGGGVISCKLNSLWVFENNEESTRHNLLLDGPFVSMKYQRNTGQLLVSSRPNSRFQYSRHAVSTLEKVNGKINCNVLHCFQGGGMQKLLSKSCFITSNSDYVAAYQESNRCVYLWSINSGRKVASVPAHDVVLDLCGIENNNGDYLVSLTERKLEFFKFH